MMRCLMPQLPIPMSIMMPFSLAKSNAATIAILFVLSLSSSSIAKAQSFTTPLRSERSETLLEGYTEPYRDIRIGSPDTAAVAEVRVDEGSLVRVGQVIAKLEDSVAFANAHVAREAAASSGELEAARLQMLTSQRKYELCLELHGRNHATDQELWNLQTLHQETVARNKAYEEMASRRRLEHVQAEAILKRMTIRSPIDGVVIERLKDVGEIVSPADPHLLRVVQLDPLRVSASATIKQAKSLKTGQSLSIKIDDDSLVSIIEFISPVADPSSGSVIVQLRVANPDFRIAAGMPCQISLEPMPAESERRNERSVPRQTTKFVPQDHKITR